MALELGRSDELLGLAYAKVDEAVGLARSLEPLCEVLLFTASCRSSRLSRAGRRGGAISTSSVIAGRPVPHDRARPRGDRWSLSPRERDTDRGRHAPCSGFADMGLEIPPVVIPVVDEAGTLVFEDVEGTARAHLAVIERGEVDAALTCSPVPGGVLLDAGVTTWRIDHARVTLVEALQRAWLASEVKKSKGSADRRRPGRFEDRVPVSGGPAKEARSRPSTAP